MVAPSPAERGKSREWIYDEGKRLGAEPPARPVTRVVEPPTADFPPNIPVKVDQWVDWSQYIRVFGVRYAEVRSPDDVVAVCNWAAQNNWKVRAVGESHNWSPILLSPGMEANPSVMLIDMSQLNGRNVSLENGTPYATFGAGVTMDAASAYLASVQTGTSPQGYAFPHLPAPGNLTLGGVLAIGGHGTAVPQGGSGSDGLFGGLSNLITSITAVVSDASQPGSATYSLMKFSRRDSQIAAFLVHLGRAVITEVTMRVVPNYYLQLTPLFPKASDLFASPAQPLPVDALTNLLDKYGRVEVLWFPFTDQTFAQCNEVVPNEILPQVTDPYAKYPFMNDVGPTENAAIKSALVTKPDWTPYFTEGELIITKANVTGGFNGIARNLELYLKDTTLQVQLFGWVLQTPRALVQQVASDFFTQLQTMIKQYAANGQYPVNGAMEIRLTTVDEPDSTGVTDPAPAALAATHPVNPLDPTIDTVIWLNVGYITGTPGAFEFFTALEAWLIKAYGSNSPNYLRPEWSKAFAYTSSGPWTNTATLQYIRDAYSQSTDGTFSFDWAAETLSEYDGANLFTNPFLTQLFST